MNRLLKTDTAHYGGYELLVMPAPEQSDFSWYWSVYSNHVRPQTRPEAAGGAHTREEAQHSAVLMAHGLKHAADAMKAIRAGRTPPQPTPPPSPPERLTLDQAHAIAEDLKRRIIEYYRQQGIEV